MYVGTTALPGHSDAAATSLDCFAYAICSGLHLYNIVLHFQKLLKLNRFWPHYNVHFLHNWRCGGTSMSSNFYPSSKLAIHLQDSAGLKIIKVIRAILTISRIRDLQSQLPTRKDNILVGGHVFQIRKFLLECMGCWMNYRTYFKAQYCILVFIVAPIEIQWSRPPY